MAEIRYDELIPNNVDLSRDPKLRRALESWQPSFLDWWREAGPARYQDADVWLRTAISTAPGGWANFGYVRMPEYRWGIFLADPVADRRIGFGDHAGEPVWQEVPGEHRAALRRLIVVQADTEPASVEQQRHLADTAPSLYDLRNLFQVNVEEARHLWAMVYLLHAHFGRDGRDEADALLARRAGDADKPRLLDAFNQACPDWLTFFLFTAFTDRDGKFQLAALAESGFDPLSRSCRFMLTEEAHHLFVGETGVQRVLMRTAELMRQDPNGDVRAQGGIDAATLQKYVNYWFAYCLDLFGGEISSNAADWFAAGLKGRYREGEKYVDHKALDGTVDLEVLRDGALVTEAIPMRNAMNELLREDYANDCRRVVARWNKALEEAGAPFRIELPSTRFFRRQGIYAGRTFDPQGRPISAEAFAAQRDQWLPTEADRAFVASLMKPALLPGQYANWISPPSKGIDGKGLDFQYVR